MGEKELHGRYNAYKSMEDKGRTYHESEAVPASRLAVNVLELERIPLDPLTSGFEGVILELTERDGLFTLSEISPVSGNLVLRFTSRYENFVRDLFQRELRGYAADYAGGG